MLRLPVNHLFGMQWPGVPGFVIGSHLDCYICIDSSHLCSLLRPSVDLLRYFRHAPYCMPAVVSEDRVCMNYLVVRLERSVSPFVPLS